MNRSVVLFQDAPRIQEGKTKPVPQACELSSQLQNRSKIAWWSDESINALIRYFCLMAEDLFNQEDPEANRHEWRLFPISDFSAFRPVGKKTACRGVSRSCPTVVSQAQSLEPARSIANAGTGNFAAFARRF